MAKEQSQKNELVIIIESSQVEESQKLNALQAYSPFMDQLGEISEQAQKIDFDNPTDIDSKISRELRLKLVKVRTGAEKLKADRKQGIILLGKLEDHATGVVVTSSKLMEERLEAIEKVLERKAAELLEQKKSERLLLLEPFEVDTRYIPIGSLSDQDFQKLLSDSKILFSAKKAEEKRLEELRIAQEKADIEAREAQRLENERLKAEAIEKELQLEKERAEAAKIQAKKDAELKAERDKNEAALKKQQELTRKKDAELKAEKEKQAKLLAEQQAKEAEAERKRQAEAAELAESQRKAALAPDREKLLALINQLDSLAYPSVESTKAKIAVNDTIAMVEKLKAFIVKRSEEL